MVGAHARRFAVAYVALALVGGAAVSSAATLAVADGRVVPAQLAYTPPPESPFMANLRQVGRVLPQLFLTDYQVAGLGLELAPNGFDNQDPPRPDVLFTFPLPGQSPRSVMVMEFYDGDFVAGHAQSFVRPGLDGKLGIVAWAFESESGAQRAFRAIRDLAGKKTRPADFAHVSALYEDEGLGISELMWVRGRLLLRVAFAVPDDDLEPVRRVRDTIAALVDEQAVVAAQPPVAPPPAPSGGAGATVRDRLLALRVPDLELPGGMSTDERVLGGDAVFQEPSGGVGASSPLLDALSDAGFVAGYGQNVLVAGQPRARFGLVSRAFPDGAAAERALQAVLADQPMSRRVPSTLFPGAWVVRGPNGDNYSDVWWVRGPLLLQAGVYSNAEVPQKPEVRDALARLLDERASRW